MGGGAYPLLLHQDSVLNWTLGSQLTQISSWTHLLCDLWLLNFFMYFFFQTLIKTLRPFYRFDKTAVLNIMQLVHF